MNLGFYVQSGTEQGYLFRVVILGKGDAHRHTLLYLYEVAGGIIHRNHGVGIAGCGRKGFYLAMEYYTRDGIGGEIYSLAHGDAIHLSLTIIGYHPYIVIIHDAGEHLSWLHQLTFVNILSSHHTIAGCHDYGIGKIEASQIELCLCHALSGT